MRKAIIKVEFTLMQALSSVLLNSEQNTAYYH